MKTRILNGRIRANILLCIVAFLIVSTTSSLAQDSTPTFKECKSFEDSCLIIGDYFIKHLSEQEFEALTLVLEEDVFFRALIPSSIVTLNNSQKSALKFKTWFGTTGEDKFEIIESSTKVLTDCLHISYEIFTTYKGDPYQVEQQVYCEIEDGKISKLSLICSGFRSIK